MFFLLPQWELDIDKLVHIIVINYFSFEEFKSGNPPLAFIISLATKFHYSWLVFDQLTFSNVSSNAYFKIISGFLKQSFITLIYVFNLDNTKWLLVLFILSFVMIPSQVF